MPVGNALLPGRRKGKTWFGETPEIAGGIVGRTTPESRCASHQSMIRKLKSGQYRLDSRKKDASGNRRNLGTFSTMEAAKQHERKVQYFKRHSLAAC